MSDQTNRRRFLLASVSAGTVLGMHRLLALTPTNHATASLISTQPRQSSDKVHIEYLAKGLRALARAHQVNTMAGHLGAAVVAGYFIAEQHPNLDDEVCRGIEGELDRIVAGESVFSPRGNATTSVADLFEPFPNQASDESLIDGIADSLTENIDRTRQSGHNVIFASIAIRAMKDHPEFATPAVIDGIRKLIAGFNGQSPGSGYYGKSKGRINGRKIALPDEADFPPYANLQVMTKSVLDALIEHASERRVGYGGLTHIINHAAAIAELAHYGYNDLAIKALPAHHEHVQLWRTLPDVADEPDQGHPKKAKHDPRKPEYWHGGKLPTDHAKLTHRIKTLYGFDALTEGFEDATKMREGDQSLRYLM